MNRRRHHADCCRPSPDGRHRSTRPGREPRRPPGSPLRFTRVPSRSSGPPKRWRRAIAADERQAVEPETHRVQPTLYLGVDGTGIPVRKAETAQRQGQQPDGSAKTREVKLAVAWTAERRHPQTGIPMRDPDSISHTAAIETAASRDTAREPSPHLRPARLPRSRTPPFRRCRPQGHARRRRALDLDPRRRVFSPMRSRSSTSSTPKATSGTSPRPSTHPGPTSPRSGRNNDMTNSTPAASAPSSPPSPTTPRPATRPANASTISSATVNACAIPRSGPGGLCVATGVVEAGCKHAIGARLKRAGMHWSVNGANAIPRPALLHPQRPLRSLLGTTQRRRITRHSQI